MRLRAFREGDVIPEGAKYVRSEDRYESTGRFVTEPSGGLLGWLVQEESIYEIKRRVTVSIYEVPE